MDGQIKPQAEDKMASRLGCEAHKLLRVGKVGGILARSRMVLPS